METVKLHYLGIFIQMNMVAEHAPSKSSEHEHVGCGTTLAETRATTKRIIKYLNFCHLSVSLYNSVHENWCFSTLFAK